MELDFTTVFSGLMVIMLVGALVARSRQGTVKTYAQPKPLEGIQFVAHRNVSWVEASWNSNLSFCLGSATAGGPAVRVTNVHGVRLSTENEDIVKRFEKSERLHELLRVLFTLDGGLVKSFVVHPQRVVVTFNEEGLAPRKQDDCPELYAFLRNGLSKLEKELKNVSDMRTTYNRREGRGA